jgi:hypothetical protein
MTDDRVAAAWELLDGAANQPPAAQVDALEQVHAALVAELDDLRDGVHHDVVDPSR